MKIFISQYMGNKTNEQIAMERHYIVDKLEAEGHTVIDTILDLGEEHPLYYLGESLKLLSNADAIYLMDGWENGRGCRIEKLAAEEYGIPIFNKEAN